MVLTVGQARSDQTRLLGSRESVSVSKPVATELGVRSGVQLRLRAEPTGIVGAFTVRGIHSASGPDVRMAKRARNVLNVSAGFEAAVRTTVPDTQLGFHEAWRRDDCVETVWHEPSAAPEVAFVAPHGGDSERNSDESAIYAAKAYGLPAASLWAVHNFGPAATERWHVTSDRIAPASYPGLQQLEGTPFERVVSFHLWNGSEVVVGGLASADVRTALAAEIDDALNGNYDVVTEDAKYMGTSETNVVNRLSHDGRSGIQIEAPPSVYQRYRKRLGERTAAFLHS